ncbi:MAG: 3'-5' exonuclease [Steroidobacteraceae bacterium]
MFTSPLVVLDFETTGLSPEEGDRITEVGAVRIHQGGVVERFQSLVNCGIQVSRSITAYTGINQQMVDSAPPVSHVLRRLLAFIGNDAVVAHNARVDENFLRSECRRLELDLQLDPFICSMQLSRRVYPHLSTHSLATLAWSLGLARTGAAHRAGADAELTAALMLRLGADLAAQQPAEKLTPRMLRRMTQRPAVELSLPVMQGMPGLMAFA